MDVGVFGDSFEWADPFPSQFGPIAASVAPSPTFVTAPTENQNMNSPFLGYSYKYKLTKMHCMTAKSPNLSSGRLQNRVGKADVYIYILLDLFDLTYWRVTANILLGRTFDVVVSGAAFRSRAEFEAFARL